MSRAYRIRDLAVSDLEDIWLYSLREWSADQADKYVGMIVDAFEWLTAHPDAGKDRSDIKPGYFSFPVGRHLVFYLVVDGVVEIIGIPHQSMDVIPHLEDDTGQL